MAEARHDWAILADPSRRAQWPAARTRYNAAIATLFDQVRCGPGDWDSRAAALGTRISTSKSTVRLPAPNLFSSSSFAI
jgi:hypothetical protein